LSYFYKNRELPARLAWFWTSYVLTNIASAFLAYGILHLDGHSGFHGQGWRYLFAIEGGLTGFIGILAWYEGNFALLYLYSHRQVLSSSFSNAD
jgi:hypothetical protein